MRGIPPALAPSVLLIALLALLAPAARAQPPEIEPSERRLETLVAQAGDGSLSPARRSEARDEAISLRRALIEAHPAHERAPVWRLDQAADLLARLASDASDGAVLFALPDEATLARARDAATKALRLCEGGTSRDGLASRRSLLRARAACILAGAAHDPPARERLAREALEAAREVRLTGDAERLRGGCEAWALVELGEASRALDVAERALAADDAGDVIRFELWLVRARAMAMLGDGAGALEALGAPLALPPVSPSPEAPYAGEVLLLAEAWARIAAADARTRGRLFELALRLFDDPRARAMVESRPELLHRTIASIASRFPDAPRTSRVRLSLALSRLHADPDGALALLDRLAASAEDGRVASEALWTSAAVRLRREDAEERTRAVDALLTIAREHAESARAPEALEYALAWGRKLAGEPGASARASALYDEALALVPASRVARRDAWLYERARRLALRDDAGAWRDALDALEEIAPASEARAPGDRLHAAIARRLIERAQRALLAAQGRGEGERARALAEEIAALARRAAERSERAGPEAQARSFRADHAEALVDGGHPEGGVIAGGLLAHAGSIAGGEARLRLIRARAMLASGDRAGAFEELRRVTRLIPEPAGDTSEPRDARAHDAFWRAWTLIVEILAEENRDGARTGTILARLAWLRQIDPELGGEKWRPRLEKVRGGLGPREDR